MLIVFIEILRGTPLFAQWPKMGRLVRTDCADFAWHERFEPATVQVVRNRMSCCVSAYQYASSCHAIFSHQSPQPCHAILG